MEVSCGPVMLQQVCGLLVSNLLGHQLARSEGSGSATMLVIPKL